jgi:hypothetical protein
MDEDLEVGEGQEEPEEPCRHSPAAWRTCTRCVDAEGDMRFHEDR